MKDITAKLSEVMGNMLLFDVSSGVATVFCIFMQ